jgi:hypothetical protein
MKIQMVIRYDGQEYKTISEDIPTQELGDITETLRETLSNAASFQIQLVDNSFLILCEEAIKKAIFIVVQVS